MASHSNTNKKAEPCPDHHRWQRSILRISWKDKVTMKRLESELDNIAWMTYSVKEDSVGLDM